MAATGFASLGSVTLPDLLSSSPRNSSLDLESGLDLTRVSDRLLVAGRCWSHQTDRQGHRNNTNQLAEYLNHTFNGRYMIYNFASSDMSFDESLFRYQMQKFTLPRNLTPALKAILHACRSMAAFLSLHSQNVVVVQCRNGIGRSGLVVACFLRYCGLLDSAADAFEYFLHKRFLNTHQLMMEFQVQQNALAAPFHSPTLKRYLRYFNDTCVLGGSVPNPHVLSLRQVIINTIPNFDGNGSCKPGIEVYQNGKMIFTSRPSLTRSSFDTISSNSTQDNTSQSAAVSKATRFFNAFSRRNSSSATSSQLQLDGRDADHFYVDISKEEAIKRAVVCRNGLNADGVPLVLQDDNHIVFCLSSLHIREDIHIRIFHHHQTSNSNYTMFNVVFNTGFIQAGLIRLRLTDLELPLATNPMAATAALSPLVAASGSWSSITTNASTSSLKSSSSSVGSTSSHHESNGSLRNVPSSIDPRFASDFSVDLIIDSTENEPAIVNYQKAFDTTQVRNLLKLSQFHAVKPEPLFIKALEMQGYRQFFARIALQLSDNDIHMAHEFLVHLVHSPIYADLDQDLLSTEQITNSLAIDTPINEDDHDDVDSGSASIIGNESVDSISSTSTSRSIPNSSSSESISQAVDSLHISSDQIQLQDAVMKPNETLESLSFGTCIAKVTTDQLKVPAMQSNHLDLMAQIRSRRKDFEGEIKSLDDNCTVTPKDIALSVPSTKAPIPPPILKTKGGIPPTPPLPPNGKAPPPPPLPSKTSAISCKIPTEVDPNKPKARHRFHWEECSVPNVVGTIWDQSAEFPIDRDRFEELFCINPASFSSQSTNLKDNSLETEDTPRRAQTIVLDLRRVNNVGIALARFYRRMDTPAIISAICTRKPGVLSVDDLLALKTALPTTDEQTLLKEFINKPEELGAVEKFMLESLSVPLLAWMIDCLLFERQFDTDVDVLCSKLTKMTEAIIMVKDCKALGILLQAVLQLGNLINYEYGKHRSHQRQSQPKAFVLDSLLKLKDVKGADQKITLLVYLISCLESSHPEVLSLPLQLSQCAVVRHWEMDGLLQQAQGIINQHGKLKLKSQEATLDQACALFVEDQRSFLARSSEKLDLLQNLMTNLRCAWKDCREHFGENSSTGGKDDGSNCMCKPEALFAVLDEFCSDMSAITTETVNTRRKSQSADLS